MKNTPVSFQAKLLSTCFILHNYSNLSFKPLCGLNYKVVFTEDIFRNSWKMFIEAEFHSSVSIFGVVSEMEQGRNICKTHINNDGHNGRELTLKLVK